MGGRPDGERGDEHRCKGRAGYPPSVWSSTRYVRQRPKDGRGSDNAQVWQFAPMLAHVDRSGRGLLVFHPGVTALIGDR